VSVFAAMAGMAQFIRNLGGLSPRAPQSQEGQVNFDPLPVLGKKEDVCSRRGSNPKPMCDDDMSDDNDDMPLLEGSTTPTDASTLQCASPRPVPPGASSFSLQMAECKKKIEEFNGLKQARLEAEDYMGAHHIKQWIVEQEQKLQSLQQTVDSLPTPMRCGTPGRRSSPGPKVSVASGPRRMSKAGMRQNDTTATVIGGDTSDPVATLATAALEAATAATANNATAAAVLQEIEESDGEDEGEWHISNKTGLVELPGSASETYQNPFALERDNFDRLYPYQRAGVAWMARLFQGTKGGVLADEMGLGKTVQLCSLLAGARKAGATHALLLMPVTLLDQWKREAQVWCPGWPVYTYHGSKRRRRRALNGIMLPQGGLLLMSYQMLRDDIPVFDVDVCESPEPLKRARGPKRRKLDDDDGDEGLSDEESDKEQVGEVPLCGYAKNGERKPWDIVICDEAHRMKNISSLLGKSLRQLRSRSRFLLTGTPVQNALQDLWALFDFAHPGLLGNHATFVKHFSDPIDRGSVKGATAFNIELKKHLAEQLRSLISPYLLRRTKVNAGLVAEEGADEDVNMADRTEETETVGQAVRLAPKRETIVWLTPSEEQVAIYKKVLEKSEVIREAAAKMKLGIEVFRAIGLLKRLCNHPMLALPVSKKDAWSEVLAEAQKADKSEDEEFSLVEAQDDQQAADHGETDDTRAGRAAEMMLRKLPRNLESLLQQSAKLRCLSELLPALTAKGHRTLVFCQSLKMLDLIQICVLKKNNIRCLRIDGGTDATTRAEKVRKFQTQIDRFQVMLLTTQVGGVGLNLTSADRVIVVDPAWNPATDAQAVDRAFRIGQKKEVRVYRLVMSGLIEDKMFRLQVFKMGLTKTALEGGESHRYFSQKEIRALFDWVDPAEGETRKLLLEKQGEAKDKEVNNAALEDGASNAGPIVGMSDFTSLFASLTESEDPSDDPVAQEQVVEAREKLGEADEKAQMMASSRQAAESDFSATEKALEEAISEIAGASATQKKAAEDLKDKRRELVQARSLESQAQRRLEKAMRERGNAQDKQLRAEQALQQAGIELAPVMRTETEALEACREAGRVVPKALDDAQAALGVLDGKGKAANADSVVDAELPKLRATEKAFEKARKAVDQAETRHAELEHADEELSKAEDVAAQAAAATLIAEREENKDSNAKLSAAAKAAEILAQKRDKERARAEQMEELAQKKAETSREAATLSLTALIEAATALADSFKKTEKERPKFRVPMIGVAQRDLKSAFKQLVSAGLVLRKSQESWTKTASLRRKRKSTEFSNSITKQTCQGTLDDAESEYKEALQEEERCRQERGARETDLMEGEAANSTAELQEANWKRRRDDLKVGLTKAKESVKCTKSQEKEAAAERQALHTNFSKVEQQQLKMETAKSSAIEMLQAEEYKSDQVEEAFLHAKAQDAKRATKRKAEEDAA